jgi:hypothetical protein
MFSPLERDGLGYAITESKCSVLQENCDQPGSTNLGGFAI